MALTPSIELIKQGPYEGGTRQWSNRYHFDGGAPTDATKWAALAAAVRAAEKLVYTLDWSIVATKGYNAGSDLAVYSDTTTVAGTFTKAGGDVHVPLWNCALIRYSTTQLTSKNHPIYLFSYMHGTLLDGSSTWETLATDLKTALTTYANAWVSGFSDGAITHHRAGPNGAVAQSATVHPFLTHRDFPN